MKKIVFAFISVICCISAYSQDFKSLAFNLPNNTLVEMGVKDGAFLISHSYQICDTTTKQKFGRYGSDIFGLNCGLAIKVRGGYVIPKDIVTPWDYDENFAKYKDKYMPLTYKIETKNFTDTSSVCIYNDAKPPYKQLAGTDFCFVADSTSFGGDGFYPCTSDGNKNGWCIWYTTKNRYIDNLDSLAIISMMSSKYELSIKSDENKYAVEAPKTDNKVIGGIFVVPTSSSIGCLTFEVVGIMSLIDSKWNIIAPFLDFKIGEELSLVAETTEIVKTIEDEVADQKDATDSKKKNKHSK